MSESSSSETSTGLLQAAKDNNADAWTRLVTTYSRTVYRWCRKAGLQPADAANVVQEVLRSVARKMCDFHRDRPGDSFRGWLRTITRNKLRDYYRAELRTPEHSIGGTTVHQLLLNIPDVEEYQSICSTKVRESFAVHLEIIEKVKLEFSARDWQMFWKVVVDGQSAREAGAGFGASANAVRIVKTRILRRLREELGADTS